jgi:hypothetical protein
VEAHLYDPSTFYASQERSLAQVDRAVDARMAAIYDSLPGERLSFSLSLAGTMGGVAWLAVAGTAWAIAPGVIAVGIVVVWIIAGTRRRPVPPTHLPPE